MEDHTLIKDWTLEKLDDLVILTQNDEYSGTVNHVAGHPTELGKMWVFHSNGKRTKHDLCDFNLTNDNAYAQHYALATKSRSKFSEKWQELHGEGVESRVVPNDSENDPDREVGSCSSNQTESAMGCSYNSMNIESEITNNTGKQRIEDGPISQEKESDQIGTQDMQRGIAEHVVVEFIRLNIDLLSLPSRERQMRRVSLEQIEDLKKSLKGRPDTPFVPMIGHISGLNPKEVDLEKVTRGGYIVEVLGGGHTLSALKSIQDSRFKDWPVRLYAGLNVEQCLRIASDHNLVPGLAKPVSFEDKVRLFRKELARAGGYREELGVITPATDNLWRERMTLILGCKRENFSAKYKNYIALSNLPEDIWKEADKFFGLWKEGLIAGQKKGEVKQTHLINFRKLPNCKQLLSKLNRGEMTYPQFRHAVDSFVRDKNETSKIKEVEKKTEEAKKNSEPEKAHEQKLKAAEELASSSVDRMKEAENKVDEKTKQIKKLVGDKIKMRKEIELLRHENKEISGKNAASEKKIADLTQLTQELIEKQRQLENSNQPLFAETSPRTTNQITHKRKIIPSESIDGNKRKGDSTTSKKNDVAHNQTLENQQDKRSAMVVEYNKGKVFLGVLSKPGYLAYCKHHIGIIANGVFVAKERPGCFVITKDVQEVDPQYVIGEYQGLVSGNILSKPDNLETMVNSYIE